MRIVGRYANTLSDEQKRFRPVYFYTCRIVMHCALPLVVVLLRPVGSGSIARSGLVSLCLEEDSSSRFPHIFFGELPCS